MGKCAAYVSMAVAGVMALIWLILTCIPSGWQTKSTLVWNFHVGLYYVKVDRAIVGSIAHGVGGVIDWTVSAVRKKKSSHVTNILSYFTEGEESLRYYRDMFCNAAGIPMMSMNCSPWEQLLWGSWFLMISNIITIILLILGICFQYYYVAYSHRKKVRRWSQGFYVSAGCMSMVGLGAYTGLSFRFGHWLSEWMITSARCTFSFLYILALMVHLFTWTPCLVSCTCVGNDEAEEIAEDMAWEKKKLMYGDIDDVYFGPETDGYGNPIEPMYDEYGNPINESPYHVSAYDAHPCSYTETTTTYMPAGDPYAGDPYAGDPYAGDPYSQQQPQPQYYDSNAGAGSYASYPQEPTSGYQHM